MDYAYGLTKLDEKDIWNQKTRLEFKKEVPSKEWIEDQTKKMISKYSKLYTRFKDVKNIIPLLISYDHIKALNNISLSVHPKLKNIWKKQYGLTHELFGAFYNTDKDLTYCSIFPEIENSKFACNAYDFYPEKDKTYLVNPPYTVSHIKWSIRKILDEWKESNFIVVVPVWDKASRKKLGLKVYEDLPEITELIQKTDHKNHKITKLQFYDGVNNKDVILKDPVHLFFVIRSNRLLKNTKKNMNKNFSKTIKHKKILKNKQKGGNMEFNVFYDNIKIIGQLMNKNDCSIEPKISIADKSGLYTLVMRDPDAPGGNFLHWLVCNIKDGIIDSSIVPYYGPNPPSSHSHLHHYIFELYKQNELIDCSSYKDIERSSFDVNGMVSKNGLKLVGSVFFVVDPKA